MSLINEALKRSEAERRTKCSADTKAPVKPEVTVKAGRNADKPKKSSGATTLLVVCAAILCVAAYLGARGTDRLLMAQYEPVSAPAEDRPSPELREPTKAETQQQDAGQMAQADLLVASTLQSVDYYDPIAASAANAAVEAEGAREDEVETPSPKEPLAANAVPSTADFKLSAIVRGPDGATAIINGRFVKVGGTVSGATLVKLGRHTAELEVRGQKLLIQM